MSQPKYDAVVVGAGPNGLSAAVRIAQEGRSVLLIEANEQVGGAARSAHMTLPGFLHDVGSAVHPLALGSPFLSSLPLGRHGLEWLHPGIQVGHPLDGGRASLLVRDIDETARRLGADASRYRRLMVPLVAAWPKLREDILTPMMTLPAHPGSLLRFGVAALLPASILAHVQFRTEETHALFAGIAAHSGLPFHAPFSSAVGVLLSLLGHAVGWPIPAGGAQAISNALAAHLAELGGEIRTSTRVQALSELPSARAVLLDITPRQLLRMAGGQLNVRYRRALERYRYGPASFKVDFALDGPIPWAARELTAAGTIHLGGSLREIAEAEAEVAAGRHPARPYVLLVQPSLFDPSRAPVGKHTAWAYCHVPLGSDVDMTASVVDQIERFAPGFRDRILALESTSPSQLEAMDANLVEGDIMGGSGDLWQTIARPILSPAPYRTPIDGVYLCSSSTPPGPGVHGMCGYNAAELALRERLQ
ncbi:MAG: phytoene desaturase family protein [Bacteroidota bacterium]